MKSFRNLSLAFSFFLCACVCYAQKGSIEATSREDLLSKIGVETAYSLPEFSEAHVYYKDGSMTKSKLNVCAFDNSVRFINGRDTLKLRSIGNVDYILTENDKFLNREGVVYRLLRDAGSIALGERKRLKLSEPKNESGYGGVPASSSAKTSSNDDFSTTDTHSYGYLVNVDYSVSYDYYLIGAEGKGVQAKRAAFEKAFPALKDRIRSIVKLRRLNLDKREDVLYLFDYCLNESK
ncbi:MAG: hypothetical protein ACI3Y7_05310 [Candidatus Cryptobacteroides sp.]